MKKIILSILLPLSFFASVIQVNSQPYTLVVYNVENLFDADGYAVFEDYRPFDRDGNPLYTPAHVLTKVQNTTRLMARYNDGNGPDVIVLSEMESDFTPLPAGEYWNKTEFLKKYQNITIDFMLGDGFDDEIRDLPSELLLLKAMEDFGLKGYDFAVAYDRDENGRPNHVQKNVVFSRLPIQHDKTRSHPINDARPILEVWLDVHGYDLIVFANHWKSRASDAEVEKIRVQNATVLRNRLDQIKAEVPHADIILGGDFNSDYNQSHRYPYMEVTAVNDVLRSVGDERKVKRGETNAVYNLWYEYDINRRGSDVFRGYWGTLMQIMISSGLYDYNGIQYVDNSFAVGRFPGKNVFYGSYTPRRWHNFENGGGYSDHLPISMKFTVVDDADPNKKLTLENPGVNDDHLWSPIAISYVLPDSSEVFFPEYYQDKNIRVSTYFEELFYIQSKVTRNSTVNVNGELYQLWSPRQDLREYFLSLAGKNEEIRLIGRLGIFRGQWQFVIDDEIFINPEW